MTRIAQPHAMLASRFGRRRHSLTSAAYQRASWPLLTTATKARPLLPGTASTGPTGFLRGAHAEHLVDVCDLHACALLSTVADFWNTTPARQQKHCRSSDHLFIAF